MNLPFSFWITLVIGNVYLAQALAVGSNILYFVSAIWFLMSAFMLVFGMTTERILLGVK